MDGKIVGEEIISPPKYQQLYNYLYEQIRTEAFTINEKLPSEEELAKRFRVSRGTVRQALSVLEKDGIVETIHGIGTIVKRKTKFSTHKVISFISTDETNDVFNNEFYVPILTAIVKSARKRNIKVLYTSFTQEEMIAEEEIFFSHIGDACVIVRGAPESIMLKLHQNHIPFVLIGNVGKSETENAVIADNFHGAYIATEYLIKLGHRNILHIAHDLTAAYGYDRRDGYLKALQEYGIRPKSQLIVRCDTRDAPALYRKLDSLKAKGIHYTAVFAASDHRAIMILDYFRNRGIKVPAEISVIGFDDLLVASGEPYNLTTIHVDRQLMGTKALELLIRQLENPAIPPQVVTIPVRLVERSTCGPLKSCYE